MPWKPSDAKRHTKKARSGVAKRQFAHVANSVLARTGDEGSAIRAANAVVRDRGKRKKKRSSSRSGRR